MFTTKLISFTKKTGLLLLIAVFTIQLTGCHIQLPKAQTKRVSKSGFYFDTIIQITLYGTSDETPIDECFQLADKYEKLLSNTISTSDISKINANAGSNQYTTVNDETLSIIQRGISFGDLSNGAFDITIGPLSDLWNFSSISENLDTDNTENEVDSSVLPKESAIENALSHVNYHNISIKDHSVLLLDAGAHLDLGAIAKGYIADQMKSYLNNNGYSSGIINLGGNVLTLGPKESAKNYAIGIQKPFSDSGETIGAVYVKNASVVTSGTYQRYYKVNGVLYHHILNTQTGYPCDTGLSSVTIINQSSMDGDALSTTCFALGKDAGQKLIENTPDTEAIFITTDGEIYLTSGIHSGSNDPTTAKGITFVEETE